MKSFYIKLFIIFLVIGNLTRCARRGTPTGGPIDSIPPVVVKTDPELRTTNFKAEKIKIYFDEYIKIKDLKKNLIISPPQKYEPVIYPAGSASKYISIKILDTLSPNTTYLYNFGNSIVDNNEENELGNFKYVFSTGNHIDSLTVSGKVFDNTIKESVKGIDVMLYAYDSTYTDSIIYKEKPRYITNTLDTTLFELTNLKAGKYLIMALNDNDNNKIYNPETDKIGFINDTVTLPTNKYYPISIFKEILPFKMTRPKEVNRGKIMFGYQGLGDSIKIEMLTKMPLNTTQIITKEKEKDTLYYWYMPFEADSLQFRVTKNDYQEDFIIKPRSQEIDSLKLISSVNRTLHYSDTLFIQTNTPIVEIDTSLIQLTKKMDSVFNSIPYKIKHNVSTNRISFLFDKEFESAYSFTLKQDAFEDIYGVANDSLALNFETLTPENYGTIKLSFRYTNPNPLLVELYTSKDELVRKKILKEPENISFEYLPPATYYLRVIIDKNGNGKWDTGNFLTKTQPEKILYFTREFELRANWEENEIFNLEQ